LYGLYTYTATLNELRNVLQASGSKGNTTTKEKNFTAAQITTDEVPDDGFHGQRRRTCNNSSDEEFHEGTSKKAIELSLVPSKTVAQNKGKPVPLVARN
jgi:hypothetical protein